MTFHSFYVKGLKQTVLILCERTSPAWCFAVGILSRQERSWKRDYNHVTWWPFQIQQDDSWWCFIWLSDCLMMFRILILMWRTGFMTMSWANLPLYVTKFSLIHLKVRCYFHGWYCIWMPFFAVVSQDTAFLVCTMSWLNDFMSWLTAHPWC